MSRLLNDYPASGSQLKKHLCYANFSSNKKRDDKLNKAASLDLSFLAALEN
jgi:hypothetical protein